MNVLLVGLGGFLGSVLRYLVALSLKGVSAFPLATLAVNVVGCFVIGVLAGLAEKLPPEKSHPWALFLSVGMLGGFTTFSAFGLETTTLIRTQSIPTALANVLLNVGLGIVGVVLGRYLVLR